MTEEMSLAETLERIIGYAEIAHAAARRSNAVGFPIIADDVLKAKVALKSGSDDEQVAALDSLIGYAQDTLKAAQAASEVGVPLVQYDITFAHGILAQRSIPIPGM